jgi:hypothetical protein
MKINFFKKENNLKKKNFQFNPNFYWQIILGSFFIIILFIFYFGYNLFKQANEEPIVSTANGNAKNGMIDENRISKILDLFSERDIKSNQIINSPAPVVDPSL